MRSSSRRNWPRRAWAWVKGAPRPRHPFFFIHLAASIVLFGLAAAPVPHAVLALPVAVLALAGLYLDLFARQRDYRFGTFLNLIGLLTGVSQSLGYPEIIFAYAPLAALYTVTLGPLPSALLFLGSLFHLALLEVPAAFGGVAGLILLYLPLVWISGRRRRKIKALEERLERLCEEKESELARRKTGSDFSPPPGDLMETVHEVSEIGRDLDPILFLIKQSLEAHTVAFLGIDGQQIRLKSHLSDSPEKLGEYRLLNDGCLRAILLEKKPLQIDDIQSDHLLPPYYAEPAPIRAFLGVPVRDGNVMVGILAADRTGSPTFSPADYETMIRMAAQISWHLRRSKIVRSIGATADAYKSLYRLGNRILSTIRVETISHHLLDAVNAIVETDLSALFVVRDGRLELAGIRGPFAEGDEPFDYEDCIIGWIARHGQEYQNSDLEKRPVDVFPFDVPGMKSFLGLPLMLHDRCVGVLALGFESPEAITARHREILNMMTLLTVTALSNAELHGRIERLAITDGLTDLFNHQHFEGLLQKKFRSLERYPEKLTIMLLDIDHFKKINDTYGHPAGDAVLRQISRIIRKTLRNVDIPARYGGEEFAAMLDHTGPAGARKMAERLRRRVSDETFQTAAGNIRVTVSIGLASYPDDSRDMARLIELADKALYHSKHSGRNRVTASSDIPELIGLSV